MIHFLYFRFDYKMFFDFFSFYIFRALCLVHNVAELQGSAECGVARGELPIKKPYILAKN